jgi:hypothetical protein
MVAMVGVATASSSTASASPAAVAQQAAPAPAGGDAAPSPLGSLGALVPQLPVPELPLPQVNLGPVAPIVGLPISHVEDEAKADEIKIYNAALANDDEDRNSEDNRDYDKSFRDNGDSQSKDDADSEEISKDYKKDFNKDDGDDDGDGNGGNDDNNSGPAPQVSNAPVGGVAAGDGTTSPAGYVIGALALAGMGGAAAVTARRSARRRMGRHEA